MKKLPHKLKTSNAPLVSYYKMLEAMRPYGSPTITWFIEDHLLPLGGYLDKAENYIVRVGNSRVLWSSHTDTVHYKQGYQNIALRGDSVRLAHGEKSNCLGADCSTGAWLMSEMIKENVPGLYVFHAGEEVGGIGSRFIADHTPELLDGIDYAIALDRKGTDSIITHQGARCCSDTFARSLIPLLPNGYQLDHTGIFTDTANYTHIVPECSNISVGYHGAHGSNESQSITHLLKLREALLQFDESKLKVARDPFVYEEEGLDFFQYSGGYYKGDYSDKSFNAMVKYISAHPEAIADCLDGYGITLDDLREYVELGKPL